MDQDKLFFDNVWSDEIELEALAELQAVILWSATIHTLDSIGNVPQRGVYLVERFGQPVYVGIAWNGSIGRRWRTRLATFRQLKVPTTVRQIYRIRIGTITAEGGWGRRPLKDLLETAERVLIRYLLRVRKYGLTNIQSKSPFTVQPPGIRLTNSGAKPDYLPQVIRRAAGKEQEVSAPPGHCPGCGRAETASLLI
jgi:hypothetical protein